MKKVELLAPSGDIDSFKTAINNGCDAVYLGLGDFNARAKSTYFTKENIRATTQYAHLFNVRVFVTVNTLVENDEMPAFLDLIDTCIKAKVDAFIVQDLGCAYLLKSLYPNIELHASTQLGIHNLDGAILAQKLGFTRVVLSREAKIEDIIQIKQNTSLEVEYFIQGALCVAFSGNCYFSSLEFNQSGNRGKCLQPCRLPYTAVLKGKEVGKGYLLSARDLCLAKNIDKLIEAGVDCFKIEGRLRRSGYVGQAVKSYRNIIDNYYSKQPTNIEEEIHKLKKVFSRGEFNHSAYLTPSVPDNIINPQIQNHLGIPIGKITSVQKFKDLYKISINSPHHAISSGDGLKFLDDLNNEIDSLGVGNVEKDKNNFIIYTKHKLTPNLKVYLTLDKIMEDNLTSYKKLLPLSVTFNAKTNSPFTLTLTHKNTTVNYTSSYICQPAISAPTSEKEIEDIFSTINTEIFSTSINLQIDNVFIPKSALKEARRELKELIYTKIIEDYEAKLPEIKKENSFEKINTLTPKLTTSFENIYIINEDTDLSIIPNKNFLIALQPKEYNLNTPKILHDLHSLYPNIALVLPTIANYKDIKILDSIISNLDTNTYIVLNNLYSLKYATSHKTIAGFDLNIYNKYAIICLQNLGVQEFIWSKEISPKINSVYTFNSGFQELMHLCHCPYKTLYNNTCKDCKYCKDLKFISQSNNEYKILRHKISQCYFTLVKYKSNKNLTPNSVIDLRN